MNKQQRMYCMMATAAGMMLSLGLPASSAGAVTMMAAAGEGEGPPLSSSFPGPLWTVVAPNGGGASVSEAHLILSVPGGSNHDAFASSNQAVRAVQPIGDVDFDVSIKIDSKMIATDPGTSQGLMVVADDRDFFTYGLATDGTRINLSVRTVNGGKAVTAFENAAFGEYQNPMYLRLARSGAVYIAYYSSDGSVWTQAATFSDAHVPTSIGPFAGNSNATPSRAVPVMMSINWFDIL